MAKTRYDKNCSVCNKYYLYCGNCSDYDHMERWHDAYCSYDCKELYNITAGFLNGWKTPQEEAERLKKINIPERSNLSDWMNDAIDQLEAIGKVDFDSEKKPEAKEEVKKEEAKRVEISAQAKQGEKLSQDFKQVQFTAKKYKPSKQQNK